jgi:hypothetical protein
MELKLPIQFISRRLSEWDLSSETELRAFSTSDTKLENEEINKKFWEEQIA